MATLYLSVLGMPRIVVGSRAVEIPSRKAVALLAYLALTARPHSRDALSALFWPDSDPAHARMSLRSALGAVRKRLGPDFLLTEGDEVRLEAGPEGIWLDATAFRREAAQALDHSHARGLPCPFCLEHLSVAANLWRGDFLEGLYLPDASGFQEWRFFEAESLRREAADVLARLSEVQAAHEDYARATESARRWLSLDSLHEPAHRALMRLYAQNGQRNAALRQYRECARILSAELHTSPDAETEALRARIMTGWPEAGTPDHVATIAVQAAPEAPAFLREDFHAAPRPLFVGRAEELSRLHAGLRRAMQGQGQVLFLTGEAGSGKTSLLGAFVRQALDAHPDLLVGFGTCSALAGMGDPYQPFREALAMLTGDLAAPLASGLFERSHALRQWQSAPEVLRALVEHGPALAPALLSGASLLERAGAALPTGDASQLRLRRLLEVGEAAAGGNLAQLLGQYADVLQALAEHGPVLLVLDDLQWSEPGSAGLLFHLSRALAETRACIVGAFRPEEVTLDGHGPHAMAKVAAEVKSRSGEAGISLDDITPDVRRAFLDALLDAEPNALGDAFRTALFEHTVGHALFTVETLRDLRERGRLVLTHDRGWVESAALDWSAIPLRVEAMIEERLERIPHALRRLLEAAAVEGEHFTAEVAARVAGLEPRAALHDLENELGRAHALVAYEGTVPADGRTLDRFRFRHNLFQLHLYDRLGPAERRLLHGDVAVALEALYGERAGELAADLGWHFEQASDARRAIPHLLRAGDQARLAYAGDAAAGFYRRAIALLEQEQDEDQLARALMRLALTYSANQDYDQSGRAYRRAFEIWGRAGRGRRGASLTSQRFRFVFTNGTTAGCLTPVVYRGLISTSAEMEVLPDLAASWEIERGGTRYVFTIREDARWSDGKPVTAEDFELAWKHMLRPGAAENRARLLSDIRGAKEYHAGAAAGPDSVGIWSRDRRTLVIDLERPATSFLNALTDETLHPAPAPEFVIPTGLPQRPEQWVVNGPYRVQEYHPGRVLFTRNPDYRGRFAGNVDEIEAFEYEDCARDQMLGIGWYETSAVDMLNIWDFPSEIRRLAIARHPDELVPVQAPSTLGFAFDVTEPPFDDIHVRRAFCMAFDRARFNRECREPVQPATGGVLPPRIMGYTPGIELPYDPARARILLAKAGYPGGRGLPRLGWVGMRSTGCEETRRFWQQMYAENLGIDPGIWDVSEPPLATWWHDVVESVKPIGSLYWYVMLYAYPDPDCYLRSAYNVMIQNHNGWQDPEYYRLIQEARVLPDPAARARLYRQADAMLMQQAALILASYSGDALLVKPWVKWMPILPNGCPQFEHMIIEPH